MKRLSFVMLALCHIFLVGQAQNSPKTVVGLNLGFNTLTTSVDKLDFWFVDESPSQDNITSSFFLLPNYRPFMFKPYLRFNNGERTSFDIEVYWGFNANVQSMGTHVGIFQQLSKPSENNLKINVGLFLGYGGAKLYLGNIYQNDVYIEINGHLYYDDYLAVHYRERQMTLSPQIQFEKKINSSFEFTFNLGYRLRLTSSFGDIVFQGEYQQDTEKFYKEQVSIRSSNLSLIADGQQQYRKLFNQSGVFANLGIGFLLQ
jgi:hypothetical protein